MCGEGEGWCVCGGWGWRVGGRMGEGGYQTQRCHHHNDFCIRTGTGESRFNFHSLVVRGKFTKAVFVT